MQNRKKAAANRRGRPREYDPTQALARARDAFWKNGYAGTSLDALSDATQMKRPSLYGAFGDKQDLYIKVLEAYAEASLSTLEAALAAQLPFAETLRRVYDGAIAFYTRGKGPARGCFLLSTGVAEAAISARAREVLSRTFRAFDGAIAGRIQAAVDRGELPAAVPPEDLARVATAVMHSIAVRARAGVPPAELEQLATNGVALICAPRKI